jgi:imidazolonepropionase-like amidohydrolase
MRRTVDFGSLEPNKVADLLLLDANPLDDIRHVRRINAVVIGGRLLGRSELDALLNTAERSAAAE